MSTVIALVYPSKEIADEVYQTVSRLQAMGLLELLDACVAVKKENGKIKLQQAYNLPLIGAANGVFLGALVGLFFMMPGLGAVAGAIAGTVSGALADIGISDQFMKDLVAEVQPGNSVLFLYVRDADVEQAVPEIAVHGGKVLYTSLTLEQENRLKEIFKEDSFQTSP
jgi:uncharacterized membrane protein